MNQQLISYYFGGKQGLLDELRRRWASTEAEVAASNATFAESLSAYMNATLDRPDWARLVIWQALGDDPGDRSALEAAQRAKLREAVHRTRRRQRAGEIAGDIEAEFVLLLAHLLAFAPVAMPQIVQAIFGVDPLSAEYRQRCITQLIRLVQPGRRPDDQKAGGDRE
jgi:TetR/AcrR family transcriptional regulator